MILRLTVVFVRLALTLFVPVVLPPFLGCVSGASEFERESYDSHSPGNVDGAFRSSAGIIVVVDVESRKILAAKSVGFPGKQLMRPGCTRKPFVLIDIPGLWETESPATIHLPAPDSHRDMRLD